MIYLALGSNLGNRFDNLRQAISKLSEFFELKKISHIIETEALLLPGSPESWNIPYLNMMLAGDTNLGPQELLKAIKKIEEEIGRDMHADRWSPRIIDIDIVSYHDQKVSTENLTIPHKEINNRDFWKYLLKCLGFEISDDSVNEYAALNYYVLDPKFIKIVNVTPDSFFDGGKYFSPEDALNEIVRSYQTGATYVDIGAQSTRPGYTEISAREEIQRLEPIVKEVPKEIPLSIDSYFDEVVEFCMENANVQIINDIKFNLSDNLLKKIADKNLKIVTLMSGMDFNQLGKQIEHLKNLGIKNIIVDPGIGFGKTKVENFEIIKNIEKIKSFGCEILIGHSRKSFISWIFNGTASDREIETLAISNFFDEHHIDYIRIHDLEHHMKFFTAKKMLQM